jgi:hypothetical protein
MDRFQDVQRTGVKKEKESLERARAVSYRPPDVNGSQSDNDAPSSNNQVQQHTVLQIDKQTDLQGLEERGDQLRRLEV